MHHPASRPAVRLLTALVAAALLLPGPAAAAPAAGPPAPTAPGGGTSAAYYGSFLSACTAYQDSGSYTVGGTFNSLLQCPLTLSRPGRVLMLATASVGASNSTDAYEANFRLDYSGAPNGGLPATERYVDVRPDSALLASGDGTDRNLSITAVVTVTAGYNSFALIARRTDGDDPVTLYDANLTALYLPDGIPDLLLCGQASAGIYRDYDTTLSSTVGCVLDLPRPGLVFVVADGWLGLDSPANGPYEARAAIGVNNVANVGATRYVDVLTDTVDGFDTTLAASNVISASAGLHEFELFLAMQSGDDPARVVGASLAALYVPFDSGVAQACRVVGAGVWSNATTTNTILAGCAVDVPRDSWAFISATGSTGLASSPNNQAYEGQYGLALDGLSPIGITDRYVNSYPHPSDGVDGNLAVSVLTPITSGEHTINLVGRRRGGASGTAFVRTPVLFVLVPGAPVFLPAVSR